jgi:glyoxylase-like metal-dependent hydrolase (beta-lactamase superfamily II)
VFTPILLEARNPGPMTGRGNNTYLVADADGTAILVDAGVGHPDHLDAVDAALAERRARLTTTVVTHGHGDHASGAASIAERHPGTVFKKYPWPDVDARYLVGWQRVDEGSLVTAGGETLAVLRTPGHSPDHIALWHEPSRSLFTGDLVTLGSSVVIDVGRGGDLQEYLASLERLLALEPQRLFPGHGPRIDDPAAVLTASLEHRRTRERQVLAALAAGHATVEAIAESIYDGLGPELMMAARENVRAHLLKLKNEGHEIPFPLERP